MRKFRKLMTMILAATAVMLMMTGCFKKDYIMFEDGEFDGVEFSDYDMIHNAELDMDDTDRD